MGACPPFLSDLLADLVRLPSVNPALAPESGTGEAAVAAFARDCLATHGVRAWLEPVATGRPNLVAEVGEGRGNPEARTLVLCAHLDTVGIEGMARPFEPRVEAGRLFGRGAYDMKGGVAAVMAAMTDLQREPPPGRVLAALLADEEHASLGAQAFVAAHRADGCILTEPSEGDLVLAHKGFAWLEVTVAGRAAHGSRCDLGDSAIENAAAALAALRRFDREVLRGRAHPLVGPASQHVATIAGGSGWSTYAERCTFGIERRLLPGEDAGTARSETAAVLAEAGVEGEIRLVLDRPPLVCDRDAAVAVAARAAVAEVTGRVPRETGVAYWMDAAIFAASGIPTVDYGPSGAGAHETVEWVDLSSVAHCARVLAVAARRFLG